MVQDGLEIGGGWKAQAEESERRQDDAQVAEAVAGLCIGCIWLGVHGDILPDREGGASRFRMPLRCNAECLMYVFYP